jgi:hypothetical protein
MYRLQAHKQSARVIDVLEHFGATSAKPPARKGQENGPAERRAVLQQKKRHDRNQNEPWLDRWRLLGGGAASRDWADSPKRA